ncbi:unnamed protein product [[Candida] boidinii]|nr:unnamed protein product [[Candida] boidinii]
MDMSDNSINSNNNKSHNNTNNNNNNNNNYNNSANNSMSLADISMNSLNSVPSSPLKDNQQSTVNPLDPALKALIEKYNSTVVSESKKTKNSLNTIERSVSDPSFLQGKRSFQELDKKSDSYGEADSRIVPIIARKTTLNESFRDGFSKVQISNGNHGKAKSFNSLTGSNITNPHRDNETSNIHNISNNNSSAINANEINSSTPFGDSGSGDIPQLLTMIANNLNKNNSEDDLSDFSKDNINFLPKSNFTKGISNNDDDYKINNKGITMTMMKLVL